ncbi:MAG: Rpn family recombination-promoting nuclease/putative transposase, partial [Emergencia sp.]
MKEEIKERRTYQDSVFRMLFSDKESAIELFNALTGSDMGPDTDVIFTTLDDVLYQGVKNDLGFIIEGRYIVLHEHQSTISENIPMRQLQYIARSYETVIDSELLYRAKLVKVPTPEFFVIYTGEEEWDADELRLSDSFIGGNVPENSMELVVKIIKVVYNEENEREKSEILQRSSRLQGYSILLHYIREERNKGCELKEAIDCAVARCLKEGILVDFLKSHSSEVGTMLYDDITRERFLEIRTEEAMEEGRRRGFEKGLEEG